MLPVARAAILDNKAGRCASGKVVLGAGMEDMRFIAGTVLGSDVDAMPLIGMGRSRSGSDGTANAGEEVVFICCSCETEMKVKGSIGYGVSDEMKYSSRQFEEMYTIQCNKAHH